MRTQKRRYDDDDDRDFDAHGILRDGGRWRVPTRMMDSIQRQVADAWQAEAKAQLNSTVQTVTDGSGDASPFALGRPGWRIAGGGNQGDRLLRGGLRQLRDEGYVARDAEVSNAWQAPPTGEGSHEFVGEREGDPCTRNGWPGVLRRNGDGELYCEIGRRDAATPNKDDKKTCPDCDGDGEIDGEECETCGGTGEVDTASDRRTVDQVAREHRQMMAKLYAQRDAELSEQWRSRGNDAGNDSRQRPLQDWRKDARPLDQRVRERQQTMAAVYAEADAELRDAWRRP